MVINFESAPLFLSIARRLSADRKFGYTMGDLGELQPTGKMSHQFLRLQTDDNFRKKINNKSMQQILLETLGMKWNRQTYDLATNKADDDWAREFFYENEIDIYKSHFNKVIGFNIGTSNKLRTKRWSPKHYHKLAQMVQEKHPDWKILILAGPEDITQYDAFPEINAHKPLNNLIFSGYGNTISRFISLVQQTSIVVSADTFGMHVAIGLEKIVVALFGPQPFAEVELYDRGKKLKLDLNCTPCFKGKPEQCFNVSHLACMQNLEPNYVFGVLEKQLNNLTNQKQKILE
jgi:heptosyltransferase-2